MTNEEVTQVLKNLKTQYGVGDEGDPNAVPRYWNHTPGTANNPASVTSTSCNHSNHDHYDDSGNLIVNGLCGCNAYGGSIQCYAFSLYLANVVFGANFTVSVAGKPHGTILDGGWKVCKSLSGEKLEPGDVFRFYSTRGEHSAMVWEVSKDGTSVTVAECWGGSGCKLHWGRINGNDADSLISNISAGLIFLLKAPKTPTTAKIDLYLNYTSSNTELYKDDLEYTIGSTTKLDVLDNRTNYRFSGWYTARSGGTKVETFADIPQGTNILYAQWEKATAKIDLYLNYTSSNTELYKDDLEYTIGSTTKLDVLDNRTNYRFDGWYTAESGGTKVTTFADIPEGQTELFAHWVETVYVKFMQNTEANGGPVAHEGTYDVGSTYGTLPDPNARDARYSFLGWHTSQNSGDRYYNWSPVKSHRTQIWAHWKYDIELYLNDGDATPVATVSAQTGNTYGSLVSAEMYTKYGYKHTGWAYDEERTNVCNLDDYVDNKTNKLYAIWEAKKMKVTVDYNLDNMGSIAISDVEYGSDYGTKVLTGDKTEKIEDVDGYVFKGWYLPVVDVDTDVRHEEDHTLTAMWEPIEYEIPFVAGDSEFAYNIPAITVKHGQKYGCLPTPKSKDLYAFSHWDIVYEDGTIGDFVTANTVMNETRPFSLCAEWIKQKLIEYHYWDNGEFKSSVHVNYGKQYTGVPTLVERTGYDVRWVFSEDGSAYDGTQFFPGMIVSPEHPMTIKAVYTAKLINVTYDYCGGQDWDGNTNNCINSPYNYYYDFSILTRPGYTFTGWYYDAECTQPIGENDVITNPEAHTVYAGWKKNITLTFDPGDSTFAKTVEPKTVYFGEPYGDLPVPKSADNYLFYCWVETDENGDTINSERLVENTQDHTAVAIWSTSRYLTLNPNRGTCNISSYPVSFGNKYPRLPLPTREGYNFDGWYFLDENGTFGTKCERKDGFFVLPEHPDTVYAKWIPVNVTVTFNGMGGTPAFSSYVHSYGSNYALPYATRTGYTFNGWFFDENCTEQCTVDNIVTNAEDHTLYAGWSIDEDENSIE